MLVEVPYLHLKAGCSFRVAMQHVWYDRFDKGSDDVDREVRAIESFLARAEAWICTALLRIPAQGSTDQSIQLQTVQNLAAQSDQPDDPLSCIAPDVFTMNIPATASILDGSSVPMDFSIGSGSRTHNHCAASKSKQRAISGHDEHGNLERGTSYDHSCGSHEENELSAAVEPTRRHGHALAQYAFESQAGSSHSSLQAEHVTRVEYTETTEEADDDDVLDVPQFELESSATESVADSIPLEDRYHPGSGIDRTWRYGTGALVIGALPQTVKIFAMKGIPWTQSLVALYLTAYIVPEVFRLVAGQADAVELHPLPILVKAKDKWNTVARAWSYVLFSLSLIPAISIWLEDIWMQTSSKLNLVTLAFTLAIICTFLITSSWKLIKTTQLFDECMKRVRKAEYLVSLIGRCYRMSSSFLTDTFALDTPTLMIGPSTLLVVLLTCAISVPLLRISWDGYIYVTVDGIWVLWMVQVELLQILMLFYALAPLLILTTGFRLIFRLLFIGSFSSLPRRLTGVKGSLMEFWSGCLLLYSLGSVLVTYPRMEWDSTGTYKPGWAEVLG
jgi:hypothetical protein